MRKRKDIPAGRKYIEGGGIKALPHNLKVDFLKNKAVYFLLIPIIVWYLIFCYAPMGGIVIAFENFIPRRGIFGSEWVGWQNFKMFFESPYFWRILKNTVVLSAVDAIFTFPAPIIFALLVNEVRSKHFKKTIQTVSYMPHFISVVVICGIVTDFFEANGALSYIYGSAIGNPSISMIGDPKYFRLIYVLMNLWQGMGYGSIIYLSSLSGVDQQLYEAAAIDGASRWKQTLHITLPGISPTIIMMLIMKMSSILAVATDKILLLYSSSTYETADVLGTYIYRMGILGNSYGVTTAVGLLNSVIGMILLLASNSISKKITEQSLF